MSDFGHSVLFVDDDDDVRKTAELLLKRAGYTYFGAPGPSEALSRLASDRVDVILLDLNFSKAQTSGQEGLALLGDILRHDPQAVVIVVTGHSGLTIAVEALRNGACDFIMKPWNNARLIEAVEKAAMARKPADAVMNGQTVMIGASDAMQRVKAMVDRCAALTTSVLIRGEAGTGKTLTANVMHRQSARAHLVTVDASMLSFEHLSDEPNTTVLIENIERVQASQIGALQAWIVRAPRLNSRIVSTTTLLARDLGLDRGLTYSLSTIDIEMPPLRERTSDIIELAQHFMRTTCRQHGFAPKTLSVQAQSLLSAYGWADNVHALRHLIERSIILSSGHVIDAADLGMPPEDDGHATPVKPSLSESEKSMIEEALRHHNFNVSAAANELGLTRPALYRRMSKYGL
jgi:DNA-binding NtrC family response regulator